MKLTIDERLKHRLVGLAVIMSVIAIFLPAILKKANQPFDALSRVSVRLPAKPAQPEVKMVEEARMFKSVKMATIKVQPLPATVVQKLDQPKPVSLAPKTLKVPVHVERTKTEVLVRHQAKPDRQASLLPSVPQGIKTSPHLGVKVALRHELPHAKLAISARDLALHSERHKQLQHAKVIVAQSKPLQQNMPHMMRHTNAYAVQVARFVNVNNAAGLTTKLKSHGFQAHYVPVRHAHGVSYIVLVGQTHQRAEVVRLQRALVNQMQLNGFVVSDLG